MEMNSKKRVVIVGTYDVCVRKNFAFQITENDKNWHAYILGNLLCSNKSDYELWNGYGVWNSDLFKFEDNVIGKSMSVEDIFIMKNNELVKFIPQTLSISEKNDSKSAFEKLFE